MKTRSDSTAGESGMSLTEALVALLLLSMIMVAFLGLLDSSSRMAKVQGNIADSTENVRFAMASIVRVARMAGNGGFPLVFSGEGNAIRSYAVDIDPLETDNVAENTLVGGRMTWGGADTLTLRGSIDSELWDIDGEQSLDFSANTLTIPITSPVPGATEQQDLTNYPSNPDLMSIILVMNRVREEPIVIGSYSRTVSDYRIVMFPEGGTVDDSDPSKLVIPFSTTGTGEVDDPIKNNPGGVWVEPAPGFVVHAGFVRHLQFFIGKNDAGLPSLYRFTGGGTADELIPNIVDLQVAYGCDVNMDGVLAPSEWYLSSSNTAPPDGNALFFLRELRISVVSRSPNPEMKWDKAVDAPENSAVVYDTDHRHRVMTVRVKLRVYPRPKGV